MRQIKNNSRVLVFDARRKWSLTKIIGLCNDVLGLGDSLSFCGHLKLNRWKYPVKSPKEKKEKKKYLKK